MFMDRPKEQIVLDLQKRATEMWGAERARALQAQIEETARSLHLVARIQLELDAEEPDFLVAPAATVEE